MRSSRPPEVPPAPPPGGDIGVYRQTVRIAVGGMAEVFRALTRQKAGADRAVVIKRMLPSLAADEDCKAMFEDEARLGMRIHHDNVVEVLDRGTDQGLPYIVLEYVFGVDLWRLNRWLTRGGRGLDVALACYVGTELLGGLGAVHGVTDDGGLPLGVVHRDVSPSNIFLSVHGDVKLGDLGIAREMLRETRPVAPLGERAKGKLGYLAPEQVIGMPGDQRADVFSAGVVIAELLMGRPLFYAGSEIAVLLAIRDGDILPFRQFASKLPEGVASAVIEALAHDPAERTETAEALRARLLPFVDRPIAELRRQLGDLVGSAVAEGELGEAGVDRTSLARTVERTPGVEMTPLHALVYPTMATDPARLFDIATPPTAPGHEYEVHTAGGEILGPWRYARVVRALTTGEVGASDQVKVDGAEPVTVDAITDLVRHLPPSSRTPDLRKRTRMVETTEVYDLGSGGILGVLARALVTKDTGLLLCEHGSVRKEVYLADGVPAFVSSNLASEMLGEFLVTRGVITREELDFALAFMPRFEGKLGETLTATGLVEPVHLFRHIADQVREKLLDIFTWTGGRGAFYSGVAAPESGFKLQIDAWQVLESGLGRRVEHGLVASDLGLTPTGVAMRTDLDVDLDDLGAPDHVQLVYLSLDAPRSIGELESIAGDPRNKDTTRVRRVVSVLIALGAVRWAG